jgi:hypothetical protein
MRRSAGLSLTLLLALAGAGTASASDYWDLAADKDNDAGTDNELYHGTSQQHDLEAIAATADQDWYVVVNYSSSSYEAIIDSTSGDLDMSNLTNFQRLDGPGTTVLQTSELANVQLGGFNVALRWQSGSSVGQQKLRVLGSCGTGCGSDDQYHIRFYETTIAVPRFNNANGQSTVLVVQNSTGWGRPIAGTVYFWNAAGTFLNSTTFSLAAKAALVLNTGTILGVGGQSGTITIAHDGGYGNLAAKSVALEPSSGFSFDTPGFYKPQ